MAQLLERAGVTLEGLALQLSCPRQTEAAQEAASDALLASVALDLGAYNDLHPSALRRAGRALDATGRAPKLARRLAEAYRAVVTHHTTRESMQQTSDIPGVSRRTGKFGDGWEARVRSIDGRNSKYFADSKHGGTEGARKAAEKWTREQRRQLGKPPGEFGRAVDPGSETPPGVYFSERDSAWLASFTPSSGKRIWRRFGRSSGWDGRRAENNLKRAGFTGERSDEKARRAATIARIALELAHDHEGAAVAWARLQSNATQLISAARRIVPRFQT